MNASNKEETQVLKSKDVTIERIQSYKSYTTVMLQTELKALDSFIESEPGLALLFFARARVKTYLRLDAKADILKRFQLDSNFVQATSQVQASLKGTSTASRTIKTS